MTTVVIPDRVELRNAIGDVPDVTLQWVGSDETTSDGEFLVATPPVGRERTADLINQMRSLQVVHAISAGIDWIQPIIPPGVVLCDGRGTHDVGVAEWVLSAMLGIAKDLPTWRDLQRDRLEIAPLSDHAARELSDSTVLIVGYGSIGEAVEQRLVPFGANVVRVARHGRDGVHESVALGDLLPDADWVVLLLPMTSETRGMVDKKFLGEMKDGATLVNAARGAIVDAEALTSEILARRLFAALDVTEPEDLPVDHPLREATNVLITPHVATKTDGLYRRVGALVREQIRRYVAGEPLLNVVDGEY